MHQWNDNLPFTLPLIFGISMTGTQYLYSKISKRKEAFNFPIEISKPIREGFWSVFRKNKENKFGSLNIPPLSLHPKFFFKLLLLIQKGGGTWPDDTLATYTRYKVLIPTQEIEIDKSGHSF